MNCTVHRRDPEILIEYCAGSLEGERAAQFEKHLSECGECASLAAQQRQVWHTLDQWTPPQVSENFDERLFARIAQEQQLPLWSRWWNRIARPAGPVAIWKPAAAMLAACAMLAVGLEMRAPHASVPVVPNPVVSATDATPQIDMDQVSAALDELELLAPTPAPKRAM